MSGPRIDRHLLLCSLLGMTRPIDGLLHDIADIGWDSEHELVILRRDHVIDILSRFKLGALDAEAVERWANAIEGREDVGLDPGSRELLEAAIFDLANPVLQGPLTPELAERWIERLVRSGADGG